MKRSGSACDGSVIGNGVGLTNREVEKRRTRILERRNWKLESMVYHWEEDHVIPILGYLWMIRGFHSMHLGLLGMVI